jgi:hypothetical protein
VAGRLVSGAGGSWGVFGRLGVRAVAALPRRGQVRAAW